MSSSQGCASTRGPNSENTHTPHPTPPLCPLINKVDSQSLGLLLREHPQAEVTILEGLEGGWHHQVPSGGQSDPAGHLPKVHVGAGAGRGLAALEEGPAQVCIRVTFQLHKAMGKVSSSSSEFGPALLS